MTSQNLTFTNISENYCTKVTHFTKFLTTSTPFKKLAEKWNSCNLFRLSFQIGKDFCTMPPTYNLTFKKSKFQKS